MNFRPILEKSKEEMLKTLQGAIRIPSVQGDLMVQTFPDGREEVYPFGKHVQLCLEYVLGEARRLGFETTNMDNYLGWCEYGEGDEMVAVLGHLDVVPEGEGWEYPPYEGVVANDRIYGRGTMDDKGPTICALYALHALKEAGFKPGKRIRLIFGLNEETGSADMMYYKQHGGEIPVMGFTPDGEYPLINGEKGIITQTYVKKMQQDEADDSLLKMEEISGGTAHNIVPGNAYAILSCSEQTAQAVLEQVQKRSAAKICVSKAAGGIRVDAEGVPAHGGSPWEGENAIGRLAQFLCTLPLAKDAAQAMDLIASRFALEWDGTSMGIALEDEVSGKLSMNLGVLRGDRSKLEMKLNYRYPVTKCYDDCAPVVAEVLGKAGFERTYEQHKACIYMAPDSPMVQKLLHVYESVTGDPSPAKSIGGGTYAKLMPNILAFGPIFPGDEVREHKANEYMELGRLLDNAEIIALAMEELAQ